MPHRVLRVFSERSQAARVRIGRLIVEHGPLPAADVLPLLPAGVRHRHNTRRTISQMLQAGQLHEREGRLHLSPMLVDYFDGNAEGGEDEGAVSVRAKPGNLVPPRQAWPFKPLAPRNIPDPCGTRPGLERRAFHPITLSSNVPARSLSWDDWER